MNSAVHPTILRSIHHWLPKKPAPQRDMEEGYCASCNGSGEGMYEGQKCHACKGTGSQWYEVETKDEGDDE